MRQTFHILFCMTSLALVTACDLSEPTWVNSSRVEVHEEGFKDSFDTANLDKGTLRAIGVNYYRYGNGPMDVTVSYDPQSKTNNKQKADKEARRIETELRGYGVKNVKVTTASVTSAGDKSMALISFPALIAKPPQDCGYMPGYMNAQTEVPNYGEGEPQGYRIGCTVETMIAKQIARPGDLMGRPGFETDADGRRAEAVIWERGYYGPKSNAPLDGQNASED